MGEEIRIRAVSLYSIRWVSDLVASLTGYLDQRKNRRFVVS